jgi:hypothetical protein
MGLRPPASLPGARVALGRIMTFARAVDRVRADFIERPGLELSMAQAVRLWSMGMDDCRFVVDALVDAGFLRWTSRRTIARAAGDSRSAARGADWEHIPVRTSIARNKSV